MIPLRFIISRLAGLGVFLLALFVATPNVAAANDPAGIGIRISPVRIDLTLDPGQQYTGNFRVANSGSTKLNLTMDTAPYTPIGETYEADYDTRTNYTQIVDWVTYDQPEFSLEPGAELTVTYHINVPLDVPAGGQYAMLFARTTDPNGVGNVQSISRTGPILLAQVNGETRREGIFINQNVTGLVLGSSFAATTTIRNTGNVDFPVTNYLEIRNFFTGNIELSNYDNPTSFSVLPETTRLISLPWPDAPNIGLFRAQYTVIFLDEEYIVEKLVLILPFWLVLIVIFLIVFLIIWIILRRRSRQKPQNIL